MPPPSDSCARVMTVGARYIGRVVVATVGELVERQDQIVHHRGTEDMVRGEGQVVGILDIVIVVDLIPRERIREEGARCRHVVRGGRPVH